MSTSLKNLPYPEFIKKAAPALDSFLKEAKGSLNGQSFNHEQALMDMYAFAQGEFPVSWRPAAHSPAQISSACTQSLITCAIDVVAIMFQIAGVPEEVTEKAAAKLISDVSEEALCGLEQDFKALADATNITDQAKAIFTIFAGVYKITGIRQIIGAIEHSMKWYEWVIMGATIIAQITAWLATDGAAAVAELVLLAAVVAQTVADATLVVTNCDL